MQPTVTPQHYTALLATDHKNSVLVEATAKMINIMAYSVYGHQCASPTVATRLGFNGELRESTFNGYLLGNGYRAYSPPMMRFHCPDSFSPFDAGEPNAYAYCEGEPVMNSDPTGHSVWALFRAVEHFTDTAGAAAFQVMSKTANTAGKGVSQILAVAQQAKKAFAATFFFDPAVLRKLGPPPPRLYHKKPANHVFYNNRYPARPNSTRSMALQGPKNPANSAKLRDRVRST